MFRFEHNEFFFLFLALPVFLLLFLFYFFWRKRKLKRLGDQDLVAGLTPYASGRKRWLKFFLWILGFSSLVLALCNLQTGSKLTEVKREGAELMVCLDVSNSMLSQDIRPDRLTNAIYALERMINMLGGDRLGLIIFAGEAYVQLPITTDYVAAKMFLSSVGPGMVPVQGTNISDAIATAAESFSNDEGKNRAIILITDGEDHEQEAIERAKDAAANGMVIHSIGIGSPNGVPIPLVENGVVKGYRKDSEGQTIISRLNADLLTQIAAAGNGIYVQATQADMGLGTVLDKIDELEKEQIESKMYTDYEDQFQWFLAAALFFFLIEFLISERVSEWYKKLNLFGNATK